MARQHLSTPPLRHIEYGMGQFQIYGDESISGDGNHIVYGLLIAPEEVVHTAERKLGAIKVQYGGSLKSRFHCRELLNPHARLKTDWKHLDDQRVLDLVWDTVNALGGIGLETRVGYVNRRDVPPVLSAPIGDGSMMELLDPKQLVPFAFSAAMGQLLFDPIYAENCTLWISPESTTTRWFGKNRQVDRLLRLNRVDPVAKLVESMMTPSNADSKECPILLEAADLLAYAALRKLWNEELRRKRKSDQVFDAAMACMSPPIARFQFVTEEQAESGLLQNYAFQRRG